MAVSADLWNIYADMEGNNVVEEVYLCKSLDT